MKTSDDLLDVQDVSKLPQPDHYRVTAVDDAGASYHLDVESEDPANVVPHALQQTFPHWIPDVDPEVAILAAKQARAKMTDAEKLDLAKAPILDAVASVDVKGPVP